MINSYSDQTRVFLNLLNKLPAGPQVTFRSHVDRTMDRVRVVSSPTLTTTVHSFEIATNNPARPEVAIIAGASGCNLTPILQEAPNFSLQETTYLPNPYFLQYVAHEYNGVMIQVYEGVVLNNQSADFTITHPPHTWDSVLAALNPAPYAARERPLPVPEGFSDRFSEPIH